MTWRERLCLVVVSVMVITVSRIVMKITAKTIVRVIIFVVVHLTRAIVAIPCHR